MYKGLFVSEWGIIKYYCVMKFKKRAKQIWKEGTVDVIFSSKIDMKILLKPITTFSVRRVISIQG